MSIEHISFFTTDMEDKLTAKVAMMGKEMMQRDEKRLVTTPLALYAGAASMNTGPGGWPRNRMCLREE
jgi:hypothetical protein